MYRCRTYIPEVKTEEGYSADIYSWRYMSAQCPHYVCTTSHEGYICLTREMCGHSADIVPTLLCGHCADIYLQEYMSALYPSSVFSSGLFLLQNNISCLFQITFCLRVHAKFDRYGDQIPSIEMFRDGEEEGRRPFLSTLCKARTHKRKI